MMVRLQTCPDATRWQALLADAAPAAEVAELQVHLAGCSGCQVLLDDIAVGTSGWLKDAGRLRTGPTDPTLGSTLDRLHCITPGETTDGPPVILNFLEPSTQPGVLGVLGRYQVLEVLGQGGNGIVLKAIDPDLLRPVAVKVMAPHLAPNGTARERFKREGRTAAAVRHDHVVSIHAVDQVNGLPYLVMEYLPGGSLQDRLDRDGPLPPRDVAQIGYQAACGLAAAHAQNLIHRDVKPANILVEGPGGRVKLTDFGLARAAHEASLTQSGVLAGTPLYMSPEQARGDLLDPRSDLFSLGSVMYALATGVPPFRGSNPMGVLNRISNDRPKPIRESNPDVPGWLENAIMKLLEKDPAKRFQSAAAVADTLLESLNNPPAERKKPRVRPWVYAALAATVLLILGGATIIKFNTGRGTLIVEVNDPNVKVTLDGEDLVITGAGPHEVRLKPGDHRIVGKLGGEKTHDEIITIERDGKKLVAVKSRAVETVREGAMPRSERLEETYKTDLLKISLANEVRRNRQQQLRELMKSAPEQEMIEYRNELTQLIQEISSASLEATEIEFKLRKIGNSGRTSAVFLGLRTESLMRKFKELHDRLGKTESGRVVVAAPPFADADKLAAGLAKGVIDDVKRALAIRNQVGLLIPKLQEAEARRTAEREELTKLYFMSPEQGAALQQKINGIETEIKTMADLAEGLLSDLEKATARIEAFDQKVEWDGKGPLGKLFNPTQKVTKVESLCLQFNDLLKRLAKTESGRVVATAPPLADADRLTSGLPKGVIDEVKKALVKRDLVGLLIPKMQAAESRRSGTGEELKPKSYITAEEAAAARKKTEEAEREIGALSGQVEGLLADLEVATGRIEAFDKKPRDDKSAREAGVGTTPAVQKSSAESKAELDAVIKSLNDAVLTSASSVADRGSALKTAIEKHSDLLVSLENRQAALKAQAEAMKKESDGGPDAKNRAVDLQADLNDLRRVIVDQKTQIARLKAEERKLLEEAIAGRKERIDQLDAARKSTKDEKFADYLGNRIEKEKLDLAALIDSKEKTAAIKVTLKDDKQTVIATNAAGKTLWEHKMDGPVTNVTLKDGVVLVSQGKSVFSLDLKTGKEIEWR